MKMMIPADFTHVFGIGKDEETGEVNGKVYVVRCNIDGVECFASLWRPDEKEIVAIKKGKPIMLLTPVADGLPSYSVNVAGFDDRVTSPVMVPKDDGIISPTE